MSQNDKILGELQRNKGSWVSMPELAIWSGSYNIHSRVAELRKRGITIENRVERQPNGANHSFYRIP